MSSYEVISAGRQLLNSDDFLTQSRAVMSPETAMISCKRRPSAFCFFSPYMIGSWIPKMPNNEYTMSSSTVVTRVDTHCSFSWALIVRRRKVTRVRAFIPVTSCISCMITVDCLWLGEWSLRYRVQCTNILHQQLVSSEQVAAYACITGYCVDGEDLHRAWLDYIGVGHPPVRGLQRQGVLRRFE